MKFILVVSGGSIVLYMLGVWLPADASRGDDRHHTGSTAPAGSQQPPRHRLHRSHGPESDQMEKGAAAAAAEGGSSRPSVPQGSDSGRAARGGDGEQQVGHEDGEHVEVPAVNDEHYASEDPDDVVAMMAAEGDGDEQQQEEMDQD